MLILVDGVDCSGKSTLVAALAERLAELDPEARVEVLHRGPPVGHPLDEYERPLWAYRPGRGHHVICDRWHLGEWVYPEVLGRPTAADDASLAHIELFLRSRGALLVLLSPPAHALAERYDVRGDDLVRRDQLLEVDRRFISVMTASMLPSYLVTTERLTGLDVAAVLDNARALEDSCRILSPLATYVGSSRPQLLLLGDVRHEYRTAERDPEVAARAALDPAPAFVPYPGTSGHFLLSAFGHLRARRLGLLNANDVDDALAGWKLLGRPPTVALGRPAQRTARGWFDLDPVRGKWMLSRLGFAPHPQFVRRFAHAHGTEYARVVEHAGATGEDASRWRPTDTWFDRGRTEARSGE